MRLLFCSRPAHGHLYPLIPLALAARDAGHDVSFATGASYTRVVKALGFSAVAVGITSAEAQTQLPARGADGRPDPAWQAELFAGVLAGRTAADLAPRLPELAPDAVVYDQGELGAAVAAAANGIPAVCHAISSRAPVLAVEPLSREHLARVWADHGVTTPPIDPFVGDAYLDIVPPILQDPAFTDHPARVPLRPVPWSPPGDGVPPATAGGRRPLVYLTLGTVVGRADNLAPAVEALGRLDADVLVARGSANGPLGDVPSNVHVRSFVDQAAVVPRADLVIHHGGMGTTLAALVHGRRQLLLPKGADQFFTADTLRGAGVAAAIEPDDATGAAIEAAARSALAAPAPREALRVRDEIAAMPEPAQALGTVLERVASAVR